MSGPMHAKYGATVIMEEMCDDKDTDMTPQMTRIKGAKPDAIIAFTPATPAAVIAKNYQRLGMENIPVIGGGGVPSKEFPSLAGKIVEDGRWTPFGCIDLYAEQLPPTDSFRKTLYDPVFNMIKEMNGPNTVWDSFMRNGYDSMQILIEALKIAKTDDRAALEGCDGEGQVLRFSRNICLFPYQPRRRSGRDIQTDTDKRRQILAVPHEEEIGEEGWPKKLEEWNDGMMEEWLKKLEEWNDGVLPLFQPSILPTFQPSIIPFFQFHSSRVAP